MSAAALGGVLLAPAALPAAAHAAAPAPAATAPRVKFEQYMLPNGLRVILSQDKSAPVVAVSVTYDVGSRNEREGRTGFAHLFEHMMFQGSESVGKGEHFLAINIAGGSLNGTTNQERTNYFETLPANQLELGLFLEADRMRSLDVSQANLDNQRAVVQEEKRQSYENRPYGAAQEELLGLAYNNFAYKHTTIGSMADLDAATLQDVRDFFSTYYAPNNAVLTVVGDFDPKQAKQLIEKHFGAIPRKPAPAPVVVSEPAQPAGERRKTIEDRLARQPAWRAAYLTVPGDHPDFWALNVLGDILSGGRTSRLYTAVVDKNLALSAGAGVSEGRGPALFTFSALIPRGSDPAKVEAAIDAEVERIQQNGVTDEELATARRSELTAFTRQYRTALGKANQLGLYAVMFKDPDRINTYLDKTNAVTKEDVQRVARKYLTKENRAVLLIQPAGGGSAPGASVAVPANAAKEAAK
jgi:predicted Zn-dependent peptidase